MAIYGLFLAGSNFFAPIIGGFIANSMGWSWVLYWAAIFQGIGFVYLFFLMEETNYSRQTVTGQESKVASGTQTPVVEPMEKDATTPDEKTVVETPSRTAEEGLGELSTSKKTYTQKLKLFQPGAFSKKNELAGMMLRPLLYMFQFPVVAYAGFSYGSNLVSLTTFIPPLSVSLCFISNPLSTGVVQRPQRHSVTHPLRPTIQFPELDGRTVLCEPSHRRLHRRRLHGQIRRLVHRQLRPQEGGHHGARAQTVALHRVAGIDPLRPLALGHRRRSPRALVWTGTLRSPPADVGST